MVLVKYNCLEYVFEGDICVVIVIMEFFVGVVVKYFVWFIVIVVIFIV